MYIRFAKQNYFDLNRFKSYKEKYCLLRGLMDSVGLDYCLTHFIAGYNNKVKNLLWLAWGHKAKLINNVGIGDCSYPKE